VFLIGYGVVAGFNVRAAVRLARLVEPRLIHDYTLIRLTAYLHSIQMNLKDEKLTMQSLKSKIHVAEVTLFNFTLTIS
jgi:hypothetical protein